MTDLITVSGVSGYIDKNGTAQLSLEDVARGLGFTTVATSGNEVVRWNTVYKYLSDLGVATSCNGNDYRSMCPDYIPENIFYRLAMKAKNEIAEAFQAVVADDILPAIRKTGTYSKPMTQIEMLAAQAQAMCELERKTDIAVHAASAANQRIDSALNALAAPTPIDWQTAIRDKITRMCAENHLSYLKVYDALYRELEHGTGSKLKIRVKNKKGRMKMAGELKKDIDRITELYIIAHDLKLKMAFDGIVRRVDAKYTALRLPQ